MDINNLKILDNLSDYAKNKLIKESDLISYSMGQPICNFNILPNRVNIILEGEARLFSDLDNKETAAKLGTNSIIGLSSLLNAEPIESVSAARDLKSFVIEDKLVLELYEKDKSFKNFCDKTLFPCEALSLASLLSDTSNIPDISASKLFPHILQNAKLITVENESLIKPINGYELFTLSNNIEKIKRLSIINDDQRITVRRPFSGRFIYIPKDLYNKINNNVKRDIGESESTNVESKKTSFSPSPGIDKSSLNVGQYVPKKNNPIIRAQGELQETIATLQMIANELEIPFRKDSIEKIIRDEIRKGKKPSLEMCGGIMSSFGLHVTKGSIKSNLLTRIAVPNLIQWGHSFAIIKESNSEFISLLSPSSGAFDIKNTEIFDTFGDTVDFLLFEKTTITPNNKFNINWFLPSLVKYKGVLTQVLIASFVVQLFGLANPLLIQVIIDKVISQRSLDTLQVLGIALVIVTILGGIIGSLRTFLFTETTNRIDTKLGSEVIDHLLRLPLNYFDKRPVGELGTRVSELEKIRNFLTGQALTTILDTAFSIIYIIVMVIYSWLLTFIALGVLPIQIALTLIGSPLLRRQIRETAKENAKTQSHLVEVLTGVQTVKAQNVETVSRWKWQEFYAKYISRTFEKTITVTALQQTSQVLQQLSQLLVLWVGASLVLDGKMSLGQLIAFRIISGYVTQPLLRLSSIWQSIQELKVSFERLADIIDTPEESDEADKKNILMPTIQGKVEFRDVSFSFKKEQKAILKNIYLKINQGQFVGIAGQSGSGKSTLMKLIPRLYSLNSGKILIDNYDITKVELYSLRKQIGIVPQDPLLFSGSISDNIALTNPEISSDEIVSAAKTACAHEFIMDLPNGYSTNVGERGSSLSGGQKQRIAIARTLLSKPQLLILDEATSALDYDTEKRVCDNLKKQCDGLTVFFITHRLSTIKNADLVLLMNNGTISEQGSHDELLEKRGRYYALYRQQEAS